MVTPEHRAGDAAAVDDPVDALGGQGVDSLDVRQLGDRHVQPSIVGGGHTIHGQHGPSCRPQPLDQRVADQAARAGHHDGSLRRHLTSPGLVIYGPCPAAAASFGAVKQRARAATRTRF